MSWSQAEFRALVTKAARGAGAPPEQAARFGQAAVAHILSGFEPFELTNALEALPDGPILAYPRAIDTALAESTDDFLQLERDVSNTLFRSYVLSLPYAVTFSGGTNVARYDVSLSTPSTGSDTARIVVAENLICQFSDFAQAILVPDSAESRSGGAGAGLDDND